jgi:hypothetical protein
MPEAGRMIADATAPHVDLSRTVTIRMRWRILIWVNGSKPMHTEQQHCHATDPYCLTQVPRCLFQNQDEITDLGSVSWFCTRLLATTRSCYFIIHLARGVITTFIR